MDELTGIIDYGNFAIMPGHYINSRECVGMQLFIIETQGYKKYQQILNKCEEKVFFISFYLVFIK